MPQNQGEIDMSLSTGSQVASGNKPLPEPMLTQIYVTIWRHYTTKS